MEKQEHGDAKNAEIINGETEIVKQLTGETGGIIFSDTGGQSRAYVIDGGRIVFKFPRFSSVKYDNEIKILDAVNQIDSPLARQKVGWKSPNGEYVGLYGVVGNPIANIELSDGQADQIGAQIGEFLRKLHALKVDDAYRLPLADEIKTLQNERYLAYKDFFATRLTTDERQKLDDLMMKEMPKTLLKLGEDLVFSHGDMGDNNIYLAENGNAGIIDFTESGYLDRAADFMDLRNERVLSAMLDAYGADDVLRAKIAMRRKIRPVVHLLFSVLKNDQANIAKLIEQTKIVLQ